ncbi:MAG: hypothetical protein JWR57_45 [Mycetocola sp.]|nr:hypothetical protein [Mycetocola sp.]
MQTCPRPHPPCSSYGAIERIVGGIVKRFGKKGTPYAFSVTLSTITITLSLHFDALLVLVRRSRGFVSSATSSPDADDPVHCGCTSRRLQDGIWHRHGRSRREAHGRFHAQPVARRRQMGTCSARSRSRGNELASAMQASRRSRPRQEGGRTAFQPDFPGRRVTCGSPALRRQCDPVRSLPGRAGRMRRIRPCSGAGSHGCFRPSPPRRSRRLRAGS